MTLCFILAPIHQSFAASSADLIFLGYAELLLAVSSGRCGFQPFIDYPHQRNVYSEVFREPTAIARA